MISLKTFSRPLIAAMLAVTFSAVLIPQRAWPADLRVPPKPVVRQESAAEWRARLFEQFRRYLQQRDR